MHPTDRGEEGSRLSSSASMQRVGFCAAGSNSDLGALGTKTGNTGRGAGIFFQDGHACLS